MESYGLIVTVSVWGDIKVLEIASGNPYTTF